MTLTATNHTNLYRDFNFVEQLSSGVVEWFEYIEKLTPRNLLEEGRVVSTIRTQPSSGTTRLCSSRPLVKTTRSTKHRPVLKPCNYSTV